MSAKPVSFHDLIGISACLVLALAPQAASLPAWVLGTVAVAAALRLGLAYRGQAAPPRGVRLLISGLAIALLFLQFRTFNGVTAGTALLALMAGLKLLETQTQRDIYVLTFIIYFLSTATLLLADSFWLLSYLIAVCWLTSATLLRLSSGTPQPGWRPSLRYTGRILAQALPLALVFWLFFPRFGGPLWQMPDDGGGAESGLSDSMSPGDINQLALSDEIAFRVRFASAAPPESARYWRGPVLHEFDGRTWKQSHPIALGPPPLEAHGTPYIYTVSLEPHQHNWIFALDRPARWDLQHGALTQDYTLVQPDPVSRPIDVVVTSYTAGRALAPLSGYWRRRDSRAAPGNPRTAALAHELRAAHPDDLDYVRAVLGMFAEQAFYYTLTPPKLAGDSVDDFLFNTKRGFCGHYASAFTTLMRDAGIASHVVTGYQGGSQNPFADYWIVRQSDAHAWSEVWIEGSGWLRVDPTSSIAANRIEPGLTDRASVAAAAASTWSRRAPWFSDVRLRLDALRMLWRERILLFDQDSQQQVLSWLNIPQPDAQKLVMVLAGALCVVLIWLTWQVRRETNPARRELLQRAYQRLCAKLAALGLPRAAHEGAEDYAARVAAKRPDLGESVTALCKNYSALRYRQHLAGSSVSQFAAAVRAFRPASKPPDSRGS